MSTSHDTWCPHSCMIAQKVSTPAPLCPEIPAGALCLWRNKKKIIWIPPLILIYVDFFWNSKLIQSFLGSIVYNRAVNSVFFCRLFTIKPKYICTKISLRLWSMWLSFTNEIKPRLYEIQVIVIYSCTFLVAVRSECHVKRVDWHIGKQRRPRSDAAECSIWSWSVLFA